MMLTVFKTGRVSDQNGVRRSSTLPDAAEHVPEEVVLRAEILAGNQAAWRALYERNFDPLCAENNGCRMWPWRAARRHPPSQLRKTKSTN